LFYVITGVYILARNVATTCIFKASEVWHEAISVWSTHSSGVTCDPDFYLVHFAWVILSEKDFLHKSKRCNSYPENNRRRPIKSSHPGFVNPCFTALFIS